MAGGWNPIAEWIDVEGLFALILASNAAVHGKARIKAI
jgi:hypothetical protein